MNVPVEWLQVIQGGAAVLVLALLLLVEHLHPFFDQFRGSRKAWSWHLFRNLALGLVNAAVVAVVFAGLWVMTSEWAAANEIGLLNLLVGSEGELAWLHALGALVLLDGWMYTWHRLNHRVSFLWRFHRVHHADEYMDVTTASRFHTGEIVISSLLRVPVIAAIGALAWELILYETLMFAVVQFHHANIGLPASLDRALRLIIVTPNMHKVHHSRLRKETDSNYSSLLSIWDRLFRSFRLRKRPEEIDFGLDEFDSFESKTLKGLIRMPFESSNRD